MTQAKSAPQSTPAKTAAAVKKAQAEAAAAALRKRRENQLQIAATAIRALKDSRRFVRSLSDKRNALANHLDGFYEEIDKLTKGKALVEVTPLMVDQANEIIRDAKEFIQGDRYLDRIKEFVPAGDNPVYPDVLVAMRGVRQSLQRNENHLMQRQTRISNRLSKAETVAAALRSYLDMDDPDDDPTKADVEGELEEGPIAKSCFYEGYDNEEYFDFEALDSRNLDDYFSEDIEEGDARRTVPEEQELEEEDEEENEEDAEG